MAKILVIDDSSFARFRLIQLLKPDGHEFLGAENGAIGFEVAASKKPDCILCDLLMPEVTGFEFLKNMKDKGIDIPVVIITADIQETTKEKALQLGAAAVLNKPPKLSEIRELLNKI